MFTTTATRIAIGSRQFHSSPATRKTVAEKVSEVADKVNKGVGAGLASALDKGEKAANATKETLDSATKQTKTKAKEGESKLKQKGKGNETAAKARETKDDISKQL